MKRVPSAVWALLIFVVFYVFFRYGIAPLTEALMGTPAPLPSSLVLTYSGMVALAILLFVSVQDERWRRFIGPIIDFLRVPDSAPPARRLARGILLIAIPVVVGWRVYRQELVPPDPPSDPPGIHFSLPNKYVSIENPLPWTPENIRAGGILYTRNCAMCHGDALEGDGLFARALQPRPANFRDSGTIAQMDENYLYWRIKEGGPGLPKGSIRYRSAMPAWHGVLTDEEIWKVIMFEYTSAGVTPAKR